MAITDKGGKGGPEDVYIDNHFIDESIMQIQFFIKIECVQGKDERGDNMQNVVR